MGYRINVSVLLFLILADCILEVLRPTAADIDVGVVEYVLLAAHAVIVLAEAGVIFQLWSDTVLFSAGLLGELLQSAWVTLIILFFHLLFVILSWVVRSYGSSTGTLDDNENMFLFVVDLLFAVASWCGLLYTAGSLSDKTLYAPYHHLHVEPPAEKFRAQRESTARFQLQQQQQAIELQQRQLAALQQQHQVQSKNSLFAQQLQESEHQQQQQRQGSSGGAQPPVPAGVEDAGVIG